MLSRLILSSDVGSSEVESSVSFAFFLLRLLSNSHDA